MLEISSNIMNEVMEAAKNPSQRPDTENRSAIFLIVVGEISGMTVIKLVTVESIMRLERLR